jgi:uncharacterized pyridoxamine 5'-phosphate oxidase family protein/NAD-dependent dihydropyrimidine dehydrogenase PreA subunit
MEYQEYLEILQKEIHSTIVATINEEGNPVTCVIDMMLADKNGLYFLTAKGKAFYDRLKKNEHLSITGLKGKDTMSSLSITVQGKAREIGTNKLNEIFAKNPYMAEIYPDQSSRTVLTVFQVYQGIGEYFDLSKHPICRASFTFGEMLAKKSGYEVLSKCIGCGICTPVCPQQCIEINEGKAWIVQEHCLHCGKCYEVCPHGAVQKW